MNTAFQAYDKVTGPTGVVEPTANRDFLASSDRTAMLQPINPVIQLDVQILFDRLASRWVVGAKTSDANLGYYLCLAVSNTDDLSSPTLAWTSISSSPSWIRSCLELN